MQSVQLAALDSPPHSFQMTKISETIEPRQLSLLNTSDTAELPPVFNLPPLQHGGVLRIPDHSANTSLPVDPTVLPHERNSSSNNRINRAGTSRSAVTGIRSLLSDTEMLPGPDSLRKQPSQILQDDFIPFQLPQLPEKHHARQVVPPIIVGLHEPPDQTAHFPAISSTPFHDTRGRNTLNPPQEIPVSISNRPTVTFTEPATATVALTVPVSKPTNSGVTAAKQSRNKWTDEETRDLLLGVGKHGIGKWKVILNDHTFKFNGRNAVQLKDRFRTCFPDGYQSHTPIEAKSIPESSNMVDTPSRVHAARIPNLTVCLDDSGTSDGKVKKRTRAHRKDTGDLRKLGIHQPFAKSRRKERKPFTEEEDRNILLGFKRYPHPCWALIVRDPDLGLQSRRPTDIRDRFRIRYPDDYKAKIALKSQPSTPPMEQSRTEHASDERTKATQGDVSTTIVNDFTPSDYRTVNASSSFKMSFTDLLNETDTFPFPSWDEPAPGDRVSAGMMDISQLLLDEDWP